MIVTVVWYVTLFQVGYCGYLHHLVRISVAMCHMYLTYTLVKMVICMYLYKTESVMNKLKSKLSSVYNNSSAYMCTEQS